MVTLPRLMYVQRSILPQWTRHNCFYYSSDKQGLAAAESNILIGSGSLRGNPRANLHVFSHSSFGQRKRNRSRTGSEVTHS